MEADEYFNTYDALHEEGAPLGRLTIREKYPSGINKVVWSSFDFMTGPELRFVWEVGEECDQREKPSQTNFCSQSPVNASGEEASINDVESLDSSLSTQSGQYEEIDDPLEAELETTELFDSMLLSNSAYGFFTSSPVLRNGSEHYLGDFMTDSRSTSTLTSSTVGMNDSRVISEASTSRLFSPKIVEESDDIDEMGNFVGTVIENPVISNLDLSNLLTAENQALEANVKKKESVNDSGSDTLTDHSSYVKLTDAEGKQEEDEKRISDQGLTTSCVDSGIGVTISTHSDLSALCQSPIYLRRRRTSNNRTSPEEDDIASVLDMSLDSPEDSVTDEYFIAKFVLAEQICTTQLPSNPLMHKMSIVPTRGILTSSYIFSAEGKDGRKTIHAITFIMNSNRVDWFMLRQSFFETLVTDTVPRLKASLFTESFEDVVVRATSDLTRLLDLIGCLEKYPLISETRPLTLLYTLALFLPEEWRWCALRACRHHFNPYIRLQAIRRAELSHAVRFGIMSTWPICVVDVDQGTVCMSAPYIRHKAIRQRVELDRIESILELRTVAMDRARLDLSGCKVLECVKRFLHQIDLLPYEESTRIGFVQHLLLYIENTAYAFVEYVKETSTPLSNEKENPSKSSRFSLSECRKALDLQSDSWFHAVLAKADLLHPEIADFVFS